MRGFRYWLLLLGLPLAAALLTTLLDSAALRLAQRPLLLRQQARLEALEQELAARDLTRLDDTYMTAMQSERLTAQRELVDWQREHALWLRFDRVQLLPSIAFWVVYFIVLARLRRKDAPA